MKRLLTGLAISVLFTVSGWTQGINPITPPSNWLIQVLDPANANPSNLYAAVSGIKSSFPPSGCSTANGVIFNNATPCDSGFIYAGAGGTVTLTGSLALPDTASSTVGVIFFGGARFLHDFGATSNVCLGHNACNFTQTLTNAVGIGESAMLGAVAGANNTAVGRFAMGGALNGGGNSGFGSAALSGVTSGGSNSAFGNGAGTAITTSSGNTIVGAGCAGVVGDANTIRLGNLNCAAMLSFGTPTAAVWTFLGGTIAAPLVTDNTHTDATVCRDTTSGQFFFGSGVAGICLGTSGRQFKTDITPMVAGLDEILRMDFVNFRYLSGYGDNGANKQYGLIAQDVETVLPELARHNVSGETINYDVGAIWMMYGHALQQLDAKLEAYVRTHP